MTTSLAALVEETVTYKGSWRDAQLARDVCAFLWGRYDLDDMFIYPNISNWTDLLEETMASNDYDRLSKDEVLSMLFGLYHRRRIIDGLWESMFERGVTQKLLERLLALETDRYR